jgi:hypothetical protein
MLKVGGTHTEGLLEVLADLATRQLGHPLFSVGKPYPIRPGVPGQQDIED